MGLSVFLVSVRDIPRDSLVSVYFSLYDMFNVKAAYICKRGGGH